MKSIVTGGAGFIGSHLVDKLLQNGHHVVVLDNLSTGRIENIVHVKDEIEFIECDLSKAGSWADHFIGCNYVFHLAALADIVPSIQCPDLYFSSNVTGTLNVLEAAKNKGIQKFLYAASSSCYGIPKIYPTPETSEMLPEYPYALTKLMGEELVFHWEKIYKIPAISLRFFNVYGPRSRTSGTYGAVFGVFLAQKLANKPFTVVGDGEQSRDFTYVSDVVDGLLTSAYSNCSGEVFNLGSSQTITINKITELLSGDKIYIPKRPGEPEITFADISKIKNTLGWFPKVTIEEGMAELIKNIDYWRDAPVWTKESIRIATEDWFKYLSG